MTSNRFDERAATWDDDPSMVARAETVARAIREALPLDRATRLLEYGAGTGLVALALRESVGPITMADTSGGMRAVIEAKIAAGTITDARVWDIDLAVGSAPDEQFDVIVTVMAMHHVTSLAAVLSNFASLLPEGGHLAIVDLEQEDGSFHGEDFEGHRGFIQTDLRAELEDAGFTDITFRRCDQVVRDGVTYPLFLATSTRYQQH